jgi:hypothetical protein
MRFCNIDAGLDNQLPGVVAPEVRLTLAKSFASPEPEDISVHPPSHLTFTITLSWPKGTKKSGEEVDELVREAEAHVVDAQKLRNSCSAGAGWKLSLNLLPLQQYKP